jgi:hypothetical protein
MNWSCSLPSMTSWQARSVRARGRLLHLRKGDEEVGIHADLSPGNVEVLDRAGGVHAPVGVGGNLDLADRVAFDAELVRR